MKYVHTIAFILVILGSLNWLFIGLGMGDLVLHLGMEIARVVYILVGISAIYLVITHKKSCCECGKCCEGKDMEHTPKM